MRYYFSFVHVLEAFKYNSWFSFMTQNAVDTCARYHLLATRSVQVNISFCIRGSMYIHKQAWAVFNKYTTKIQGYEEQKEGVKHFSQGVTKQDIEMWPLTDMVRFGEHCLV